MGWLKHRIEHSLKLGAVRRFAGEKAGNIYERYNKAKNLKNRMTWVKNKLTHKEQTTFEQQLQKAKRIQEKKIINARKQEESAQEKKANQEIRNNKIRKNTTEKTPIIELKINTKLPHQFIEKVKKRLNQINEQINNSKLSEIEKRRETSILDFTASAILEKMMPLEYYQENLYKKGYPNKIINKWTKIFIELTK